jgi:uncharacterized protein (UPF0332 family)
MPRATSNELLYVSKSHKERLDTLDHGANLTARTGYSIESLRSKVVSDRLTLARSILNSAKNSQNSKTPSFRTATSRAYYAMYHTARALSYYVNGGDDHQEHSKLPANIPSDFPSRSQWENELKQARLHRNRADYDPYPRSDQMFEHNAADLIQAAQNLLQLTRRYLRGKGWNP